MTIYVCMYLHVYLHVCIFHRDETEQRPSSTNEVMTLGNRSLCDVVIVAVETMMSSRHFDCYLEEMLSWEVVEKKEQGGKMS